jgi:uncharacterized HAD superfamily protein
MTWYEVAIRSYLSGATDLRKPEYHSHPHPLGGHCYVASEAYFHAHGGYDSDLTIWTISHEDVTHWFLCDGNDTVIDLTADQFQTPPAYAEATRRGFLTRKPSKRAQTVLDSLGTPQELPVLDPTPTRLGIDIDGVVAEQNVPVIEYINETYGTTLTGGDVRERNPTFDGLDEPYVHYMREAEAAAGVDDYYTGMELIPGVRHALTRLATRYKLVIVTHRPEHALSPTQAWLDEHDVPYDHFVTDVPANKAEVTVDLLIDDYSGNVADFVEAGKHGVQFIRPSVLDDERSIPEDAVTVEAIATQEKLAYAPARQWAALTDVLLA